MAARQLRMRCVSVVHAFGDDPNDPSRKVKTSETASFGDAEVPIDVLADRKCCIHLHTNDDPENFGRFKRDQVYTFTVE
jgi:hypothetical protein